MSYQASTESVLPAGGDMRGSTMGRETDNKIDMVQTRGSAAERNSGSKNPSSAKLDTSSKDSQGHIESASPQDLSVHHEQQQQHRQQHRNFSYVLSSGELEHEVDRRQLPPCSPTMTHNLQKYIESRNSKSPLKDIPPAGVPHIYHDYSCVPDEIDFDRKKTGGVTKPFPEKLQEMLNTVEGTHETDIVSWLPHGRAFLVRKPKEFTESIMPRFFRQTKLTSFQRQLNLYGFRRITQGTDAGAYYHEMFLKTRHALCQRMARQKVKGTGHKQPADAKTEPNFYLMPSLEAARPVVPGNMHNFGSATIPPIVNSPLTTQFTQTIADSPASPSLHGAAHLLQGIATGYNAFYLPEATAAGPSGISQSGTTIERQRSQASFLPAHLSDSSSYENV